MAATKQPVWRRTAGFTMTELMVTLAVTMLVLSGLIGAYMFGMRLLEFTRPKLSASDQVRKTIGRLVAELRSADRIQVGEGSLSASRSWPTATSRLRTRSGFIRRPTTPRSGSTTGIRLIVP
ncbi:MAG: prepilin-type N-terminal cleavage/methylation domain-containing protein [Verrucomicrobiota bacterium]